MRINYLIHGSTNELSLYAVKHSVGRVVGLGIKSRKVAGSIPDKVIQLT
jgi:hypothetical protein